MVSRYFWFREVNAIFLVIPSIVMCLGAQSGHYYGLFLSIPGDLFEVGAGMAAIAPKTAHAHDELQS